MRKRNQLLNIMEAVASYMVVLIHYPLPGVIGDVVSAISRFAVPFYFAVSGFFLYKGDPAGECAAIKRKLVRLAKTILVAELVYFLFGYLLMADDYGFGLEALRQLVEVEIQGRYLKNLAYMLLVLAPVFCGIGWFMTSLAAVYCLAYVVLRRSWQRHVGIGLVITFLFGMLLSRMAYASACPLPGSYERWLLFLPAPFFALGYYLRSIQERITGSGSKIYVMMILIGALMSLCEFLDNNEHTLFFGTGLIVAGCVCLAANKQDYCTKGPVGSFFAYVGGKHTTVIYLMHMMVGQCLTIVASRLPGEITSGMVYRLVQPFLICAATTVFAVVFDKVKGGFAARIEIQK